MVKIGVIGYGYWGPNLVRNFMLNKGSQVIGVCDLNVDRLNKVQSLYPAIEVTKNSQELIANPSIDAIVIATPVAAHFDLAMSALQAGKHVLVEKPITMTSLQAAQLIEVASNKKLTLMVDHTFIYTGAVRKIRELIKIGTLGDIYYYDSSRINLGLFQHDVSVLWDLAVHDLSILDYILDERPVAVSANGISHIPSEPTNTAYLTLYFSCQMIAHVNVNWLAPVKIRRTLIGGSQKMLIYDDLETSEKIKIYDKGITVRENIENVYQLLIQYRTGDMWSPNIENSEALQTEVLHFIDCIENGKTPITDGNVGIRVVKILEAATQSQTLRGQPVELQL